MTVALNRRTFLQGAVSLGAGAAVVGAGLSPSQGIEPVRRAAGPKFKFSLAAYSYRDLFVGEKPLTLDDFVVDCAKMGLEGTELTSYYFPKEFDNGFLLGLKKRCFELGLDVSGTAVGNDFCEPDPAKRQQEIAHVKQWVDHAETLGAPVIRIFSGAARGDEKEARKLAIEAIEESCEYAGKHGVMLALENHGGLTATAEGLLSLVKGVNSPWFGVNLDTGNFNTADVYGDLARLAPYAVNVQVKVMVRPNNGAKQPTDFSKLAGMFKDSAYRGYIVLEYEEPEDPRKACPRYMDEMRAAFLT